MQYDMRRWTSISYNEQEWTPATYPVYTLVPVLIHSSIGGCLFYEEQGHGFPDNWTYDQLYVMGIEMGVEKRVFYESGQERFSVYAGQWHLDYPMDTNKERCIQDAEEIVLTIEVIP